MVAKKSPKDTDTDDSFLVNDEDVTMTEWVNISF